MKKIVLIILILTLLFPKIQVTLKIFHLDKLVGVTISTDKPTFGFKEWLDGRFQKNYESFHDQNFGLRNFFIRMFNRFDFTLFRKTHGDIIIGKDGYFFQGGYIDEVTGKNFVGDTSMEYTVKNLKTIQNFLDSKNITLLTILAPGKTYFYNEYLPNYVTKNASPNRNYYSFLKYNKQEDIRYIDFNKWFMDIKDTASFPLFPKQGIHWSYYGMGLCADSILNYITKVRNVQLPKLSWQLEFPDTLRGTDYDLGDLLNINYKLSHLKMAYPKFNVTEDSTTKKLKLLVIADSFYWTIFNEGIFRKIFDNETFYYYCSSIFPDGAAASNLATDLDLINETSKYDVVLLIQSSANYGVPGVNYVQHFINETNRHSNYIAKVKERLKQNLPAIRQKNITESIKSMNDDQAIEFLTDSLSQSRFKKVADVKVQMRNQPDWYKQLVDKAFGRKAAIDVIIQEDAEWLCDQDDEKLFNVILQQATQ
jgi:hypothetical protein